MMHGIASRVMSSLLGLDSLDSAPIRRWQGYSLAYRVAASFFNRPLKPIGAAPLQARALGRRPAGPSVADAAAQWLLLPAAERLARRDQIRMLVVSVGALVDEADSCLSSQTRIGTAKVLALGDVATARLPRALYPDADPEQSEEWARTAVEAALSAARKTDFAPSHPGPAGGYGEGVLVQRARTISADLRRTVATLNDAADSFLAADLQAATHVEQDELIGIRWDARTQWPDDNWAARIRRASEERPPGSGIFVVVPEPLHQSALPLP